MLTHQLQQLIQAELNKRLQVHSTEESDNEIAAPSEWNFSKKIIAEFEKEYEVASYSSGNNTAINAKHSIMKSAEEEAVSMNLTLEEIADELPEALYKVVDWVHRFQAKHSRYPKLSSITRRAKIVKIFKKYSMMMNSAHQLLKERYDGSSLISVFPGDTSEESSSSDCDEDKSRGKKRANDEVSGGASSSERIKRRLANNEEAESSTSLCETSSSMTMSAVTNNKKLTTGVKRDNAELSSSNDESSRTKRLRAEEEEPVCISTVTTDDLNLAGSHTEEPSTSEPLIPAEEDENRLVLFDGEITLGGNDPSDSPLDVDDPSESPLDVADEVDNFWEEEFQWETPPLHNEVAIPVISRPSRVIRLPRTPPSLRNIVGSEEANESMRARTHPYRVRNRLSAADIGRRTFDNTNVSPSRRAADIGRGASNNENVSPSGRAANIGRRSFNNENVSPSRHRRPLGDLENASNNSG
ncbi:hypothetical protein BDB01DRAFT_835325 [Pilobolus umbonatus]|nr:hypothetical protein BDB01DRAFT_835325 [Pilobolus umbonatus]